MRGKYLQILKSGLTEIFRVLATFLALYLFLLFLENDAVYIDILDKEKQPSEVFYVKKCS